MTVSDNLKEDRRTEVRRRLKPYEDIFSEVPGKTNLIECRLDLTTTVVVNTPQYPLSFAVNKDLVEEEVDQMLKMGVIERSRSPYNSPLVLVKKKKKDNTY